MINIELTEEEAKHLAAILTKAESMFDYAMVDNYVLHGMQKNRSGVWQEYDFTIWGDWYKPKEDGSYATAEYYHFWPDYTKSVRSCKKMANPG